VTVITLKAKCEICGLNMVHVKFEKQDFIICPNAFARIGVHAPEKKA
jgi:ssDNA-binding Zn-finger/Zn-ribbon topoisomerase 1